MHIRWQSVDPFWSRTCRNALADGGPDLTIMLPGLLSKPEKPEEDNGTKYWGPKRELKRDHILPIHAPNGGRILVHLRVVVVDVIPVYPGVDGRGGKVEVHAVRGNWGGAEELRGGQRH